MFPSHPKLFDPKTHILLPGQNIVDQSFWHTNRFVLDFEAKIQSDLLHSVNKIAPAPWQPHPKK